MSRRIAPAARSAAAMGLRAIHRVCGYKNAVDWSQVASAVWLSLLCAVTAVALCLVPGTLIALLLARREFRGKSLVELLITLPVVLPPVVVGYALLKLLGRGGLLGSALEEIGISIVFTWVGAALAQATVALPLLILTLRGAFATVDRDLELDAQLAGAGRLRTFWSITLPLAWPGVAAGCVLALARALGEFGATILVAGNIPGRTRTVPSAVFTALQVPGEETQALVLVGVAFALALVALVAYRGLLRYQGAH